MSLSRSSHIHFDFLQFIQGVSGSLFWRALHFPLSLLENSRLGRLYLGHGFVEFTGLLQAVRRHVVIHVVVRPLIVRVVLLSAVRLVVISRV